MKRIIITLLILSLMIVGLFGGVEKVFYFNWKFVKMFHVLHVVDTYKHMSNWEQKSITGFYTRDDYYASIPDRGHGFINKYFGNYFLYPIAYQNGGRHNDALQSFKKLSISKVESLLRKITPFAVEGIKIYTCKDRVKSDLNIFLKNLEGDFSAEFWETRRSLVQEITTLEKSTFTWSNESSTKYNDWRAENKIPRNIQNDDYEKHNKWEETISSQIKSKNLIIMTMNIENKFIMADYVYGQRFKEYVPVVAAAVRNIISQL